MQASAAVRTVGMVDTTEVDLEISLVLSTAVIARSRSKQRSICGFTMIKLEFDSEDLAATQTQRHRQREREIYLYKGSL